MSDLILEDLEAKVVAKMVALVSTFIRANAPPVESGGPLFAVAAMRFLVEVAAEEMAKTPEAAALVEGLTRKMHAYEKALAETMANADRSVS